MHAKEPSIEWNPWGSEAFAKAKKLGRPILLDIGATWCHWCHVMEETTYSDEEVAKFINAFYVPVKVDRDKNPEVDRRYQHLVALATGEGGWPLTAILTPTGSLITGGTYFPPRDAGGRPGLRRLLKEALNQWKENPEVKMEDVHHHAHGEKSGELTADGKAREEFLRSVSESMSLSYDDLGGGFGMAPKFPHPMALSYAFAWNFLRGDDRMRALALDCLKKMAEGGIYDQLGGGFHRYSVDRSWHIPHFEKLSTDNAFLLRGIIEAYSITRDQALLATIDGTIGYISGTLSIPSGGFASSQDADHAPGDDGGYYTWNKPELRGLLTNDEYRVIQRRFGLGTEGRMPHNPEENVLFLLYSEEEIASSLSMKVEDVRSLLGSAVSKMVEARGKRKAPKVDNALYSSVNGYLAGSLALAGAALGRGELIDLAKRALDRFLAGNFASAGVAHEISEGGVPSGHGLLEDHASVLDGLVHLAEFASSERHLKAASSLSDLVWAKFLDPSASLLQDIASELYDGHLPQGADEKRYPLEDNPHISPNSSIAISLLKLSSLTGDDVHADRARKLLDSTIPRISGAGLFAAGTALAELISGTPVATVTVGGSGPGAMEFLDEALLCYHPRKVVISGDGGGVLHLPKEALDALTAEGKEPVALVCTGNRCLPPIKDQKGIAEALSAAK